MAEKYDFHTLREAVFIQTFVDNALLNAESPFACRNLDDCLEIIADYVEEIKRFSVVAYVGHL